MAVRGSQYRTIDDGYLTTSQAARILGVSLPTIRKWADLGRLPFHRLPGTNGDRRFKRTDVEALLHDE